MTKKCIVDIKMISENVFLTIDLLKLQLHRRYFK